MVSIRAPVRGATRTPNTVLVQIYVSIRAPVRGATNEAQAIPPNASSFYPRPRAGGDVLMAWRSGGIASFYPRPRAGGDVVLVEPQVVHLLVSIRAPVRGATAGYLSAHDDDGCEPGSANRPGLVAEFIISFRV